MMMILYLPHEILKMILLLVAKSAGGGSDMARAMSVCQDLAIFSQNRDILRTANFNHVDLPLPIENFEHVNGLLIRCARAGNNSAKYLLAKVILIGYSYLPNYADQASTSGNAAQEPRFLTFVAQLQALSSKFTHFELVWFFLSRCNIVDHLSMQMYVKNYMRRFAYGKPGLNRFYHHYSCMTDILRAVVHVGRETRTWYNARLLNNAQAEPGTMDTQVLCTSLKLWFSYYVARQRELSEAKWEELKRECKFIAEELSPDDPAVREKELQHGYPDMWKRFYFYLLFNGHLTQEIDSNLYRIKGKCMKLARKYMVSQLGVAVSFREMFFPE